MTFCISFWDENLEFRSNLIKFQIDEKELTLASLKEEEAELQEQISTLDIENQLKTRIFNALRSNIDNIDFTNKNNILRKLNALPRREIKNSEFKENFVNLSS